MELSAIYDSETLPSRKNLEPLCGTEDDFCDLNALQIQIRLMIWVRFLCFSTGNRKERTGRNEARMAEEKKRDGDAMTEPVQN